MFLSRNTRCIAFRVAPVLLSGIAAFASLSLSAQTNIAANNLKPRREVPAASSAFAAPNYVESASTLRHWEKQTVRVRIDGTDLARTPEQTTELIRRGMTLWNERLDGTVRLEMTDSPAADIAITFVTPHTLPGKAIGRTDVTFRLSDQVLLRAQMSIDKGLGDEQMLQVVAHEMGHALGIQGHSPDKNDLMYPYAHTPAVITARDLNTMFVSYGVAPRALPSPASGIATIASAQQVRPTSPAVEPDQVTIP